jgi:hypothetical protein
MTHTRKFLTGLTMLSAVIMLMVNGGCKKDTVAPTPPARTTTYTLKAGAVLGVTGTVTFTETSTTSATITLAVSGAPSGTNTAVLCMHTVIESGVVVLTLNPLDATGKSSTVVSSMTYSDLIAYDGHINVTNSNGGPVLLIAQADIGGNALTGTNKSYTLSDAATFGVTGTALFEKRINGNTLVTLTLSGTIDTDVYPASINVGSITTTGPVTKTLTSVDGIRKVSYTNIHSLDNADPYTYDQWMVYTGYINIYQNSIGTANIICHGNIGSN